MTRLTHVRVPKRVKKGEIVRIKAKLIHPMEPGWRKNHEGNPIPRNLVKSFTCIFQGREVFRADFQAGISSDPYLSFFVRATESGTYHFTWVEENGEKHTRSAGIVVN
ncbi:MAG: thiosulfate oxidation carrier complex protein SoxZ [Gammaproteobacteria bacterium]|nr:thiosulfate oxidation carrier complex protein SoxZ [Gammaproteobacteria bacterium]